MRLLTQLDDIPDVGQGVEHQDGADALLHGSHIGFLRNDHHDTQGSDGSSTENADDKLPVFFLFDFQGLNQIDETCGHRHITDDCFDIRFNGLRTDHTVNSRTGKNKADDSDKDIKPCFSYASTLHRKIGVKIRLKVFSFRVTDSCLTGKWGPVRT